MKAVSLDDFLKIRRWIERVKAKPGLFRRAEKRV